MSELNKNVLHQESLLDYTAVREKIEQVFVAIAAYDPSDKMSQIPQIDRDVANLVLGDDSVPQDILVGYASAVKTEEDLFAIYGDRAVNYYSKLNTMRTMSANNIRTLYYAEGSENPLREMLAHQVSDKELNAAFLGSAFDILKKLYDAESIPALTHSHPEDATLTALSNALQSGDRKIYDVYRADMPDELKRGSQELRVWMRDVMLMATGMESLDQADAYVYSSSRSSFGAYGLDTMADRIKSYGPEKLKAIQEFANISALSSYSDQQLDRMYKLSQVDSNEVERLTGHDVIVALINMDGDHNGVSSAVAERLDDAAERTLFFEITNPHQVYGYLKKLYDIGILPTTLIFASHGAAGQFAISERPALDSDKTTNHVTVVIDQDLADAQIAKAGDDRLKGYDISNANGLIRSVQRFMQGSRAIDDPEKDLGRKKIVSLSCEFDGDARRASLAADGEVVKGERTTLLRRLGEVLVGKLANERIDIYGADISTNQQTATDKGFHYNQTRDGRWAPYPASVLHVDGKNMQWHRLNEVQLRKETEVK